MRFCSDFFPFISHCVTFLSAPVLIRVCQCQEVGTGMQAVLVSVYGKVGKENVVYT